ncbi:MAG: hypothetical protein M1336_03615 [Deltaproteobacteria bacterium]|nr:hypothetical protein [Deltaproteobacteria bacterium]
MTVSDIGFFNSLADSITNTYQALQTTEGQLATGKQVVEPSDNPSSFAGAAELQTTVSAINNDNALASDAQNQLNATDGALSQAASALDSAIASANEGANGTLTNGRLQLGGASVQNDLTQVLASANFSYNGVYVFGGDRTLSAPFDSAGNYAGGGPGNSVTLSNGAQLQLTFDGQSVFGNATGGLIGTLQSLATALSSGNTSAVSATLAQLNTAVDQLAQTRAVIGAASQFAQTLSQNAQAQATSLTDSIGQLVDVNLAQASLQASQETTQANALVSLASAAAKISLVNVLA